ncbi:carotenoid oxygenase family protein [Mycobacterium lepromatosis]|nr:carotenoid oxygenase family protein [Mycobacterium lepromatosis]
MIATGERLPILDRWTINLTTGEVDNECRDDRSQEFPRIHENHIGDRHRCGYIVNVDGGFVTQDEMSTFLYKYDHASGSSDVACSTRLAH